MEEMENIEVFEEEVISIRRVTKVVKGGKNLRFSAAVVVGNKNGKVGIGKGKAREVPLAIKKAVEFTIIKPTRSVGEEGMEAGDQGSPGRDADQVRSIPDGNVLSASGLDPNRHERGEPAQRCLDAGSPNHDGVAGTRSGQPWDPIHSPNRRRRSLRGICPQISSLASGTSMPPPTC